MESRDLVIIGAGPAGISTALHLMQADASWADKILILEKESHPRFKLCGGGLTGSGLKILQQLGISIPLPIPHAEIEDAQLIYKNRVIHARYKPQFHVFNRTEFDLYLSSLARGQGVHIQENEGVTELNFDEDGVEIITSSKKYRAQVVIGADGAKGIARKYVRSFRLRNIIARSLEITSPAQIEAPQYTKRYATFDFTDVQKNLQGYFWDFPSFVDGLPVFNNGVYDSRIARNKRRARLIELLNAGLRSSNRERPSFAPMAHPIPLFNPRQVFSIPRMLLVGDAAGVDPLFGEGIGPALGYGKVASKAVRSAFTSGDFSFDHYRSTILLSTLGRYLLVRWAIAWWAYRFCQNSVFMHTVWTLGKIFAQLVSSNPLSKDSYKPLSARSAYEKSD